MPGLLERSKDSYLTDSINRLHWRTIAVLSGLFVAALLHLAASDLSGDDPPGAGTSLSDDGRIGKIADHQGTVTLRPALQHRWTLVARRMLLEPGDWLRTDVRGANAVRFKLRDGTEITLGPASLVELVKTDRVRVLRGEFQVKAVQRSKLELSGPDNKRVTLAKHQVYRVADNQLVPLDQVPVWLQGFAGSTTQESLGSLIANVDGRNVPLTIGYHKVSVEIRDQIARTTIEESFINHTGGRLEGVFYFPLPQDASISGFGMWINGELIEADVVEKQRAREIYETILRERRDPGLLEWMGGNTFKARVFPILGDSEKRIKLTYTQVLPLKGNRYRYSYALQSEMLQQTPLRQLEIDVQVNSTVPLRSVACPTHAAARIEAAEHSARAEFTAQEFTPRSDFEFVVETDGRQSDVVVVPHRRADDGYLLLQLTPPAAAGNWQRETLSDGAALDLLILADTSASMDDKSRRRQAEFIAALLAPLSPEDRFNVAVCDVACDWIFDEQTIASDENLAKVHALLDQRPSLGWTDLAAVYDSVMQRAGENTHVVYVGDGVVTARGEDPIEFASRMNRSYGATRATFHAVSVSSRYETVVLQAIAAIGGGSMRDISGEAGPQAVAMELLSEITRPGLRDMQIEFRGFEVASVYPDRLPNLSAGSQQVVLARYLPRGKDQQGDVVVTGVLNGERVRYATRVSLADAESGNSFIPRLWARKHLDHLLNQGVTPPIKDEIVALSQAYHIITPYTSLLVLESDADRDRFQVQRRFQMRDGENYFAEGRARANFELLSQQMHKAGESRLGLRNDVLRELSLLARDVRFLHQSWDADSVRASLVAPWSMMPNNRYGGGGFGGGGGGFGGGGYAMEMSMYGASSYADTAAQEALSELDDAAGDGLWDDGLQLPEDLELAESSDDGEQTDEEASGRSPARLQGGRGLVAGPVPMRPVRIGGMPPGKSFALPVLKDYQLVDGGYYPGSYHIYWVQELFPRLPAPRFQQMHDEQPSKWSEEAIALSKSLLRTSQFNELAGGVQIVRTTYDTRRPEPLPVGEQLMLCSPKAWLDRAGRAGDHVVNWCNERERGVLSRAFLLGRIQPSEANELSSPPIHANHGSIKPLHESFGWYNVQLQPQGDARVLLATGPASTPTRILIDTERHVVLQREILSNGRLQSTQTFGDFVNVGGMWWATSEVWTDHHTKQTRHIAQKVELLTPQAFQQRMDAELAVREQTVIIRQPSPTLAEAKQSVADGSAGFSEYLTLMLDSALDQRWERVDEGLAAAETLVGKDGGCRWVRYAILKASQRHEQLRVQWLSEAARLANRDAGLDEAGEDVVLAEHMLHEAQHVLQPLERLELGDLLKPVYLRHRPPHLAMKSWLRHRVTNLSGTGRAEVAFELQRQLANDYPDDVDLQNQFAVALAAAGDYDAAYAWLEKLMPQDPAERSYPTDRLRATYTRLLREQGKFEELADYLEPLLATETVDMYGSDQSTHAQYLSATIASHPTDHWHALVREWLAVADNDEKLDESQLVKLNAAIAFVTGRGFEMRTGTVDPEWMEPLAETCRALLGNQHHISIAAQILSHPNFAASDAGLALIHDVVNRLAEDPAQWSSSTMAQLVSAVWQRAGSFDETAWTKIADKLHDRWLREADARDQHRLGQVLSMVYAKAQNTDDELEFLREQVARSNETYRNTCVQALLTALLQLDWTAEREDEAFALLSRFNDEGIVGGGMSAGSAFGSQLPALYALTDRMVFARYQASERSIEHPERLTRTELQRRKIGFLRAAREAFAARLREESAKRDGPLADWMKAELLYLDLRLERNFAQAEEACWARLGDQPKRWNDPEPRPYDRVLFQRYLAAAANLAVRRSAKPESVRRLMDYIDRGIAQQDESFSWKLAKYQLLVALDRPAELERELRNWIRTDEFVRPWQISLANLLAEQGRLDEAITLYETVERSDELVTSEYRNLANWYLAAGRREDYERSLLQAFTTMEDREISSWLNEQFHRFGSRRSEAAIEITPEMLAAYRALFRKAERPANYLHDVENAYSETRDFRLLQVLADAVVGHTAGQVYPFLDRLTAVLNQIEEEAAVDAATQRIAVVRNNVETAADERALDLLLLLAERRAATLASQPQPHLETALAALRRSFQHEWSDGERRLAADFLAGLRRMEVPVLAVEQRRQLRELFRSEQPATPDRLHIALRWAETLWEYNQRDDAVRLLELSIREFENSLQGGWPRSANSPLARYAGYLGQLGRFADAEKLLQRHFDNPANGEQRFWFAEQLNRNYEEAIQRGGMVSHGRGLELYEWLEPHIREQIAVANDKQRAALIARLCSVYRTANGKLEGAGNDLRNFALEPFNAILQKQVDSADSLVGTMASTIREVNGDRDRLEFFVYQIEHEPARLRLRGRGIWQQYAFQMAQSRTAVKQLGDLEPRLLKIVLGELERCLRTRDQTYGPMYQKSSYFWKEKEPDFLRLAERVYAEQKNSGGSVQHIAAYLYSGLGHHDRAIEMLQIAYASGLLTESGRATLLRYLHEKRRWQELIAILRPLIRKHREHIEYTVLLMRAYFHVDRDRRVVMLLNAADEFFRREGRWTEANITQLAGISMECQLFSQAAGYYKEIIPLHERAQPNRGVGNGTLAAYYIQLAEAYSQMHRTADAVDAATSAMVAWGPNHRDREQGIAALVRVLQRANDLEAYIQRLDIRAKATQQDLPIIRKALGLALLAERQVKPAATQLKLAAELQPHDEQTHNYLIECYDELNDGNAAFEQLLRLAQLKRQDISVYERLAQIQLQVVDNADPFATPFADPGTPKLRPLDAELLERVLTSIIDVMPNEAASHQKLAQIRERQDRWDDAILHWQQVHRLRRLEPTGLLGLAQAQIHQRQWDAARETLQQLHQQRWPERFGSVDAEVTRLRAKLGAAGRN